MDVRKRISGGVSLDDRGCWIWLGCRDRDGYGKIKIGGRTVGAHRAAYEAFVGPAGGRLVCHTCDVPACANPAHLRLGTNSTNMAERTERGRFVPRDKKPGPKLTAADNARIIELRGSGATISQLGEQFGVTKNRISQICNHWRPC